MALVGWGVAALAFGLSWRRTRSPLLDMLKTAMSRQLLIPALGSLLWNGAIVYALLRAGYWNAARMWWDTAVFVLFGTVTLVFKMMKQKGYSGRFYLKVALTNLGLAVLLGTFVSTYTFGIVVEVLLIPWMLLLGGMMALAEMSSEFTGLTKALQFLGMLTGLAMLSRAIGGAIIDYRNFLTLETLKTLLLPLLQTAAFLPYLFVLQVSMAYELACIPLRLGVDKPPSVSRYALRRMITRFGLNLSRLERFRTGVGNDLRWATTRDAVDEVFEKPV